MTKAGSTKNCGAKAGARPNSAGRDRPKRPKRIQGAARRSHSLENTAFHEAGHAVARVYLDQRFRRVTIIPKCDSLGHVTDTPIKFTNDGGFDDSPRGIARAESRILTSYAGPLASRKFQPRCRWRIGGASDFEIASKLLSHLEGADDKCNRLYAQLLWRRAELLVDLRWRDINAVAADLLRYHTLDWDGVRAAINRAHGLKPFSIGAVESSARSPEEVA